MKKSIIFSALVVFGLSLSAQQLPMYSQYTAIPYLYNPALVGTREDVNIGLLHRAQWTGISGAPTTSLFTADGPVAEKNIGLGGTIFQDVTDITQRIGFYTAYSYKLKLNEEQHFNFGLSLGFVQQRIDFTNSVLKDDNDPMLMYRQNLRKSYVDATLGVAYNWKTLQVGISVPQLIGNKVKYINTESSSYYYLTRHFVFSARYDIDVNKEQGMKVYPLALIRYAPGAPFQYDINAVFDWKKYGWAALTYRSNYAVGVNVGFRLNNTLSAGYAYDFNISTVKNYAGGGHEFFLGYTFGRKESASDDISSNNGPNDEKLNELIANDQKQKEDIARLTEEIEKLKVAQKDTTTKTTGAPNLVPTGNTIQLAEVKDFEGADGKPLKKGYYVVIGAYKSLSNAETAKASVAGKYTGTEIILNKNRGFHYVSVAYTSDANEAKTILGNVQKEFSDAWTFDLE